MSELVLNGTVERTLTLDDIQEYLSDSRLKGQYKVPIRNLVESGDPFLIVSDLPMFARKDATTIRNSLVNNLPPKNNDEEAKTWPKMAVIVRALPVDVVDEATGEVTKGEVTEDTPKSVILVNLDIVNAAPSVSDDDDESDDSE